MIIINFIIIFIIGVLFGILGISREWKWAIKFLNKLNVGVK